MLTTFSTRHVTRYMEKNEGITMEEKVKLKINEGLNLLFDIISNPDFEDNKEIKKRISEFIAISSGNFASYGHAIALERLASYWAAPAKYKDYVTGIDFLHFVKQIDKDFDNVFEDVKEKLYKVARLLFNKNNLLIAVTGDMESLTAVKKYLPDNIQSLNNAAIDIYTHKFDTENLKEGLMVDSDVQYVAAGYNYKLLGYEYSYSLEVLNSMLKYGYLWNNIRVKGGAYGIITQLSKEGRYAFVSYRDPNLKETLDTYNQMAEYIESLEMSDRELTKAIIGTVGDLYKPLPPRLLGQKAIKLYLSKTKNDFEEKLQGILNTKVEDLRTFAPMIKDIFNQDYTVVVGSNSKIKEASGMFLNTYNPLTTKVKQDNIS